MLYKGCYGLKRCPPMAHVLKSWNPGECYGKMIRPLRGRVFWKGHRSLGACPCRDVPGLLLFLLILDSWFLMQAISTSDEIAPHFCQPALLPEAQSNEPTQPWIGIPESRNQNNTLINVFLYISYIHHLFHHRDRKLTSQEQSQLSSPRRQERHGLWSQRSFSFPVNSRHSHLLQK